MRKTLCGKPIFFFTFNRDILEVTMEVIKLFTWFLHPGFVAHIILSAEKVTPVGKIIFDLGYPVTAGFAWFDLLLIAFGRHG